MKCRDMNPGNERRNALDNVSGKTLNEVPGYESRQFIASGSDFEAATTLNEVPGYESRQSTI